MAVGIGQSGRLMVEKAGQGFRVEHPHRVVAAPVGGFHEPSGVEHHGVDLEAFAGGLQQHRLQPVRLGLGLNHRIALGRASGHGDPLAVVGDLRRPLERFAVCFGFDREHAARPDQDVIDIEVLADQIVEDLIASGAQVFQILSHHPLAVARELQAPPLAPERDEAAGAVRDPQKGHQGVKNRVRSARLPPIQPLQGGDGRHHHGGQDRSEQLVIDKPANFLVQRLTGIAQGRRF